MLSMYYVIFIQWVGLTVVKGETYKGNMWVRWVTENKSIGMDHQWQEEMLHEEK